MRNQGRNRRSRAQKDNDEEPFNAVQDPHAAKSASSSYSRHHNTTPRYVEPHRAVTSSSSVRMSYDLPRDRPPEPLRGIRDEGWGHGAVVHERFDYGTYHHAEHDSYDTPMRRESDGWRGPTEAPYASRGDWNASYHQTEPSTSHPEASTWAAATTSNTFSTMTPPAHGARSRGSPSYRTPPNPYYEDPRPDPYYEAAPRAYYPEDQWSQRDVREPLPDDPMGYNSSEKQRNQGWRKENRRDKGGGQQKFQSDSGWSMRKKGKDSSNDTSSTQARWEEPPVEKSDIAGTEDRAWVPAEAWKSGNRTSESSSSKQQPQQQHREGGRQTQRSSKQSKGSRKSQQSSKQQKKGDWRTDDNASLNNWTRRDVSTSSKMSNDKPQSSSRRKHARSPSRSRSRSVESQTRSVRSTYARSRSRSSSPVTKRRRRDGSRDPAPRSPSPRDRDGARWVPPPREEERRSRSRSWSPQRKPTRRSPTYSDMSSERSRSRSPAEHRRTMHRLPAAPVAQSQPQPAAGPSTTTEKKRKKKKKNNQNNQEQASRANENKRQRQPEPETAEHNAPLPVPPPPLSQTTPHNDEPEPMLVERPAKMVFPPPQPPAQPEAPTRIVPARNSGFKPIGKPNSALKRFFPGDEEENDTNTQTQPQEPPPPPTNTTTFTQPPYVHPAVNGHAHHYPHNGFNAHYAPGFVPSQGAVWPNGSHAGPMDNLYHQRIGPPHVPLPPAHPMGNHQWMLQHQHAWAGDMLTPRTMPPQSSWPEHIPPAAHLPIPVSVTLPNSLPAPAPAPVSVPAPVPAPALAPVPVPVPPPATVPAPVATTAPAKETRMWSPTARARSPPQATPYVSPSATRSRLPSPKQIVSSNRPKDTSSRQGTVAKKAPPITSQPSPADHEAPIKGAASRDLYSILNQVGEGTFGKVYKAQNTASNLFVALKRIRMENEKDGFPVTAMREIKLLQSLRHKNVVRLYEMMVSHGSVYMVFEYMDHDLTGILSQSQFKFSDAHLKSLCHQMLAGLAYLHHKGVIHRDIKGSNILLNNRGELKLADFGLARFYQKRRRSDYTNRVITLWYRPPELLFGATIYGAEVDMWSAGCIMLELFTKKPVFQGNDEIHQLQVIFKILGTPTPERWIGLLNLPWYELVKPREALPNRFRDLFQKWMSPAALDLAEMLLTFDPLKRVTAQAAMETPYFTEEEPLAELPTGLSTLEGEWHELESKAERQRKRKKENSAA